MRGTRIEDDFQTPPIIAEYMASLIPEKCRSILEPTPGQGNIINALNGKYNITAPKDFFLLDFKSRFDCVIMNPPFSSKYANMDNAPGHTQTQGMRIGYYILYKCMEMSDNIIALMPWFTISDSDRRINYIMSFGCKRIHALPRKTFKYTRIQTIVLQLEKGFKGETEFKLLNLPNEIDL